LRPVALHPDSIPQAVDHDVPAGIHPRLPRAPRPPHPGTKYAATDETCFAHSASRWCTAPPASARRLPPASLPPVPAPARSGTSAARSPRATAPFRAFACSQPPNPPAKPRIASLEFTAEYTPEHTGGPMNPTTCITLNSRPKNLWIFPTTGSYNMV